MSYLIALMFVSSPEPITPSYKFGHCYQAQDSEYRPSVIGIRENNGKYYTYRIWYNYDEGWSSNLSGKVFTIEYVYNREVRCP